MFNFKDSLKKGELGETKILELFAGLSKLDGRHGDLVLGTEKIELKTDFYEHKIGGNFFIERYSDVSACSPGGPWQAAAHGCTYFMYYFVNSNIGYCFHVAALTHTLDNLINTLTPIEVKNKRWTTIGFKVPRPVLVPLFMFTTHNNKAKFHEGGQDLLELFDKFVGKP